MIYIYIYIYIYIDPRLPTTPSSPPPPLPSPLLSRQSSHDRGNVYRSEILADIYIRRNYAHCQNAVRYPECFGYGEALLYDTSDLSLSSLSMCILWVPESS